jgi:hypothetical protein
MAIHASEGNESRPDKLPEERSSGRCWLYSILVPLGILVFGVLFGIAMPKRQDDWIGAAFLIPYFISTVLAAITALGFSARSIFKAERHAAAAFFSGMIALSYLVFVIISMSKAIK